MTKLSDQIKEIQFLKERVIVDETDHTGVGMVGFQHDENDLYSSIIASRASTSSVIPAIVMMSTQGAFLKYDSGTETIEISISTQDDNDPFTETFASNIDEGEFFQSTLIHNFLHVNYEHVIALREVMNFVKEPNDTAE